MNRVHLYAPNVLKIDDGRLIASQRMLFLETRLKSIMRIAPLRGYEGQLI